MAAVFLGAQTPDDRFGTRREDREYRPSIASWRCNLTGLSQRYNLYFVAYSGQIYVYEPRFPTQALPSKPALVIDTPPSRPGLTGSLDPQRPRAINYLVVQPFGLEEVLAIARDDGDVDAYVVAHIADAVERRAAGEVSDVRPFFQFNVRLSAWGVAIHSAARVIAISSNTHSVTVFKFGLTEVEGRDDGGIPPTRHRDVSYSLVNGTTNIPYISFCNTGDDPDARWLLTTDIDGTCQAIDLHRMDIAQSWDFLPYAPPDHEDWRTIGMPHAGWTILFLDRRSFKLDVSGPPAHCDSVSYGESDIWDIGLTMNPLHNHFDRSKMFIDRDSDDSGSESPNEVSVLDNLPEKGNPGEPFCDLPCPILHASKFNVYLLQATGNPTVGFSDVLRQTVPTERSELNDFERLNMNAYIPSLGVLILASQKGRAMIIQLSKYPKKMDRDSAPGWNPDWNRKTVYSMRVEELLPLPQQEMDKSRPFQPLLGIAVGPIQGTEHLPEDQRRWRLMMSYCDHTILSYEITRRENATASMEDVVV